MPDGTPLPGSRRGPADRQAGPGRLPEFMRPNTLAAVRDLARLIALAEWAPDSYRDLEGNYAVPKIELAIMQGAVVGLGPIAAVQAIALIEGRPAIWGDGALAVVEGSGLLDDMVEEYTLDGEDGLTAVSTLRRRHRPTPIIGRFSIAMADQARLTQKEGPWRSYPQRMLMMRARSWALRDGFADVLRGLAIREEVEDYEPTERVGSPPPARVSPRSKTTLQAWSPRPRFGAALVVAGSGDRSAAADKTATAGTERDETITREDPVTEQVASARGAAEVITPARPRAGDGAIPVGAGQSPEELFGLIDAEGNTIEVTGIAALRAAFVRLMADRHLSPDQILGLWESNDGARTALEQALGAAALDDVFERVRTAQRPSKTPTRLASQSPPRRRSGATPRRRVARTIGQERLALEVSSAWSEARVAKLYLKRLEGLKEGSGRATDLASFREANRSIEERLRAAVPDLMAPIDTIYAWAATHAR
jgi:hypothetical protein